MVPEPTFPFSDRHSHDALLARASKVRAAAVDGDVRRFRSEVTRLLEDFLDHALDERDVICRLPESDAARVCDGQRRVLTRILSLSVAAELGELTQRCIDTAIEVATLLTLQADVERRAFSGTGQPILSLVR